MTEAIIEFKESKASTPSSLKDCHLIAPNPPPNPPWFSFYAPGGGDAVVTLDGVLICPIDMFTKRQIKMAVKKYRAAHPNKE